MPGITFMPIIIVYIGCCFQGCKEGDNLTYKHYHILNNLNTILFVGTCHSNGVSRKYTELEIAVGHWPFSD